MCLIQLGQLIEVQLKKLDLSGKIIVIMIEKQEDLILMECLKTSQMLKMSKLLFCTRVLTTLPVKIQQKINGLKFFKLVKLRAILLDSITLTRVLLVEIQTKTRILLDILLNILTDFVFSSLLRKTLVFTVKEQETSTF